MHLFIFSLHIRMFILFSCILISSSLESIPFDWQSSTNLSSIGFEFLPINHQALILVELNTTSLISCVRICHSISRCRIFDFDNESKRCRLFEGNIITMGSIIASSSLQSRVGSIKLRYEQFINRGYSCSLCQGSRYLKCVNTRCECDVHTYFDGFICQSQKLLGDSCNNNTECRMDLNYICLPRQQCGPLALQNGNLIGGYGNGTSGNSLHGLNNPTGLFLHSNGSFYVSDMNNHRVIKLQEGSLMGTIVAGTGSLGSGINQLNKPSELFVDASSNIYISDGNNVRVMLWRKNASNGIVVAGTTTVTGCTPTTLSLASGLAVDSMGNIYVTDCVNHRIMKWTSNATNGTNVAVTCDLPMSIHFYYFGYIIPSTSAYCTWWTFFEYTLSGINGFLMSIISIQRHILIFYNHLLRIQFKRYLFHFIPLSFSLIYPIILYLILIVFYPCDGTQWNYTLHICGGANCYLLYNKTLGTIDWAINSGMPILIIVLANLLLIIRVIYQKYLHHHNLSWSKQRRMTLQLFAISCLYFSSWLPSTFIAIIQLTISSTFASEFQSNYGLNLIYLVCLFLPWICLFQIPELRKFIKRIRNNNIIIPIQRNQQTIRE
ncbi:hypothetical protein I4U23_010705 [Adineta vaga]|nr:hypothetical protein I4U23_010705 [Adineta vaga]